jgi:tRNA modification GTPase
MVATRESPDDTIAAIATPPGRGGLGVIRLSGASACAIACRVTGRGSLPSRHAVYCAFRDRRDQVLDRGLVLYFPGPASFTGEDVVEFQGHGSPVLLAMLLEELIARGARQAAPGEFSQRAFLNGKLDLAQAEAVADLVAAGSARAARSAMQVLEGRLSLEVTRLGDAMLALRAWVEASIDFPDDDIDFLDDQRLTDQLGEISAQVRALRERARQGRMLRDGLTLVIAGPPNAGKSSLMNALAERDVAIVTDTAGTTRDVLREALSIDGMPVHLVDTAGLRDTDEPVEQAGIARAREAIAQADRVLYVVDGTLVPADGSPLRSALAGDLPAGVPVTVVRNKIDLTGEAPAAIASPPPGRTDRAGRPDGAALADHTGQADAARNVRPDAVVTLSARTGHGLGALRQHLLAVAGLHEAGSDVLMARVRHLAAMDASSAALERAAKELAARRGELVAEEIRLAHEALMTLTGEISTEELLGEVFSRFCIGK